MVINVNHIWHSKKYMKRIAYKCKSLLHFILAHIASTRSSCSHPNNHPKREKQDKIGTEASQKESAHFQESCIFKYHSPPK